MTASIDANFPLPPQSSPMSFSGRGQEFLKLLIAGSLLQLPTFGFYRFWFITKLRRHLWANTQIEGEAFEYTGTAKELLIGFLIAFTILTPVYLGYFLLGILLEEKKEFASLPLGLTIYALMHFGAYRARRYRASRTSFRGIRFWMDGSGWGYAAQAIKWDIFNLLTVGLTLPWAMAALERYRMRHTYFGNIQGDFVGTGTDLFKRASWLWLLLIVATLTWLTSFRLFSSDVEATAWKAISILGLIGLGLIFLLVIPVAVAIFTRWQIEGIRFGAVAVRSSLRKRDFYGSFIKLTLSSVCFLVVFSICSFAGFCLLTKYSNADFQDLSKGGLTLGTGFLIAISYLATFMGLGVIKRYFMERGLWAVTVSSVAVTNLAALEVVVAAGQPASATGEGFADALDFNVGI